MGREDNAPTASLKAQVGQALKREQDQGTSDVRLCTLRLIQAAVRDRDVCAREDGSGEGCPEEDIRRVLETMVEQREESATEYDEQGRIEDAMREREEIEVILEFLPKGLCAEELQAAARDVVEELGASKLKDLGRCVSALKQRYPGKIENGAAGKAVREALCP